MVECPYCNTGQEVCHDDGHGREEDVLYEEECGSCGKMFVFDVYISFSFSSTKAPCLNGEPHDWGEIYGSPDWYFANKRRCSYCDAEKDIKEGEEGYRIVTKEDREL